jgi:hypothetical protein
MPSRSQLLVEIEQALGSAIRPSLTSASAADNLYEAYLFSIVMSAARSEGASVRYLSISGGSPGVFVFRISPGHIGSHRHNYGYGEIEFAGCRVLEAHVGVRVSGHSNVLHECDISVLLKEEADVCRAGPGLIAPRSSKVLIAIEAKYLTGDLPLSLGRGFLGLTRDFSADKVFFVANRGGRSVEKLLSHKKQLWEHQISPSDQVSVPRLRNAFQTAFKDFKAREM